MLPLSAVVVVAIVVPLGASAEDQSGRSAAIRSPGFEREQARAAALKAHRDSAAGVRERRDSRSRFGDLSAQAATDLARREFPSLFEAPSDNPVTARRGERITGYVNDRVARVADADGHRSLAVSTLPLRTPDGSSVDLELHDAGATFTPVNPAVPVELGSRAGDGVRFDRSGISIAPVGVSDAPGREAAGQVFYADAATDTDLLVRPVFAGAELSAQLRSPDSPDALRFRVGLPEGARLELANDRLHVGVVRGKTPLATIGIPVATDAQETTVPIRYELDGDVVELRVDHSAGDYAYPIMVDPTVSETWGWENFGTTEFQGWAARQGYTDKAYYTFPWWDIGYGTGLNIKTNHPTVTSYPVYSYGMWYWASPGDSWIYRTDYFDTDFAKTTGNGCLMEGNWVPGAGWESGTVSTWCAGSFNRPMDFHCANPDCSAYPARSGDSESAMVLTNAGTIISNDTLQFGGATIYVGDEGRPTVSRDTPGSAAWVDSVARSIPVTGRDTGVGVEDVRLRIPLAAGGTRTDVRTFPCSGAHQTLCSAASWPQTLTYNTSELPEGDSTIATAATDVAGNASSGAVGAPDYGAQPDGLNLWHEKVDRSAPHIDGLSGNLAPGASPSRDRWVKEGSHSLTVNASDSKAGVGAVSGVSSDEVQMSNVLVGRDTFTRTASGGWGTADLGGAWSVASGSSTYLSTDGSSAIATVPNTGGGTEVITTLGSATTRDVEATGRIKFPTTVPTSGFAIAQFVVRRQADGKYYRAGVVRDQTGKIYIRTQNETAAYLVPDFDTGMQYAAGDAYNLRVKATGANPTQVSVKSWKAGTAEPAGWGVSFSSSTGPQTAGTIGLRAGQTTNQASVAIAFDDFVATDVDLRNRSTLAQSCNTSGCPTALSPAHSYTWNTANESEGTHTVKVLSNDQLGHTTTDSWNVRLDRTAPARTISWSPTLTSNQQLWEDEYTATVTASDSGSGVKKAELLVDGVRLRSDHLFQRSTSCDGCGVTQDFVLRTSDLTPGSHTVSINVEDFVGNVAQASSWQVSYQPGGGEQDHFGFDTYAETPAFALKVNIASGNLLVRTSDSPDVEMNVERYYNSEASGRNGAFGAGWTANVGADIRLRETADGAVVYYGPSNFALRFNRNPDGTYASPEDFSGTMTRRADGSYLVENRMTGEVLEFPSATSVVASISHGTETVISAGYGTDGALTSLKDVYGQSTDFTTASKRVTAITDPSGDQAHSYVYSGNQLQSSTDAEGQATAYQYDSAGRLSRVTLPDQTRFDITYTSATSSRVASVANYPLGASPAQTTTYAYGTGQTTVYNSAGMSVHRYDEALQVYTGDTIAPAVYEPFGYGAPGADVPAAEYSNGVTPAEVPVTVDDPARGVQSVTLEKADGTTLDTSTESCEAEPADVGYVTVCPPRHEDTVSVATAALPQGSSTYALEATDAAGHTSAQPDVTLIVDRTAPPAPTDAVLAAFNSTAGTAEVTFESNGDPDLPTGESGAGLGPTTYRYRVGAGAWSVWQSTATSDDPDVATVTGVASGQVLTVESKATDSVGNTSAVASDMVTVQPVVAEPETYGFLPNGSGTVAITKYIKREGETDATDLTVAAVEAPVQLKSASGLLMVRQTDSTGSVSFPNIAAGSYELRFLDGSLTKQVSVTSGQTTTESHVVHAASIIDAFHEFMDLAPAERSFCFGNGYMCGKFEEDRNLALKWTEDNFTGSQTNSDRTKVNAFQHHIWVALMVRSVYYAYAGTPPVKLALMMSKYHESEDRKSDNLDTQRRVAMDFHNNGVGYHVGVALADHHNDRYLCNKSRWKVRSGGLFRFRWNSNEWPRAHTPKRLQLTWFRHNFPNSNEEPYLSATTQCYNNP